jgi:small-conductance mechanosensitive channel
VLLRALVLWLGLALAASGQDAAAVPDYAAWERLATRAEAQLATADTPDETLLALRAEIAPLRAAFLAAEGLNDPRIATLREQIASLGPVPPEGEAEAPEIAARRADLSAQLAEAQAPRTAAVEAYSRADGLIREIDATLRERQAAELLRLGPSPLNPAYWPEAAAALWQGATGIAAETRGRLADPEVVAAARSAAPGSLLYLALAGLFLLRGRAVIAGLASRVLGRSQARARKLAALVLSLGQVVVPVSGLVLLVLALVSTGLLGEGGTAMAVVVPVAGTAVFGFLWLASQLLPATDAGYVPLPLTPARRTEGRLYLGFLGVLLAATIVVDSLAEANGFSAAARAVWGLPLVLFGGFVLLRSGQVLLRAADEAGEIGLRAGAGRLVGRVLMVCGVAGPVLAAAGFSELGRTLTFPPILSLLLIGLLVLVFEAVVDLYALLTGKPDDAAAEALVPVLVNFTLALAALPVLALVWGARVTDITELWTRLREGVVLGETRISPGVFLTFVLVFLAGYAATRALQATLRTSVLPRTRLDPGGRNAIVAGTGYVGIALAAVLAVSSAGIDLSAFALVLGALGVGIGLGLQNIVQNFVSGIILLVERPIAEGDWIEVGGQTGFVRQISVRSTVIETFDRTEVIVPNGDFISGQVTNYTRSNTLGRVNIAVGVAYGSDTRKVEAILREIVDGHPLVTVDPAPFVAFDSLGDAGLNFVIRAVISDVNLLGGTRSEFLHRIIERFAEEGIEIPYPQRDLWLRNADALRRPAPGSASQDNG